MLKIMLSVTGFIHMLVFACFFQDGFNDLQDLEDSLASFPIKPLEALK